MHLTDESPSKVRGSRGQKIELHMQSIYVSCRFPMQAMQDHGGATALEGEVAYSRSTTFHMSNKHESQS